MTVRETVTERPMVADLDPGDHRPMDEATLDCIRCGRHAAIEITLQVLTDAAEWRTVSRWIVCAEHADSLQLRLLEIEPTGRLMVMRTS